VCCVLFVVCGLLLFAYLKHSDDGIAAYGTSLSGM
jgi:hypothetical protein